MTETGERLRDGQPDRPLSRRALLGGALGLLAAGSSGLVACSSSSTPSIPGPPLLTDLSYDAARVPVALSAAPGLAEVVAGITAFGTHLHGTTALVDKNWTTSPLSLAVAFGMLRAGARGTTARELDEVFGFPPGTVPEGATHQALNALTASIVTTGPVSPGPQPTTSGGTVPEPVVAIANGLFIEQGFAASVQQAFLKLLATQYGAKADAVDFTRPSAAATINRWVSAQTRGRINQLFDSLDPSTLLVLANAVYLKATWAQSFPKNDTGQGAFATAAGRSVTVPLMRNVPEGAGYSESAAWQRVVLPYGGGQLSMHVVLPRQAVRSAAELTALLPVATARAESDPRAIVELTLPRWNTETDLDLLSPLQRLGLRDVGDLSGIAPGVFVSAAVHRANITVDELGTEAAAVTGIAVASSARAGTPVTMAVTRPFVWAIVHEPSGTPVFAGHVVDPTA